MARFDLTDVEWELIGPLLPKKPRGVARVDDRKVLNGIFWVLRTGSPWRDLPDRYGPSTTVYNRFNRWAKAGVWVRVFEELAARSPDSMQFIDSSIIRAHQHAATGKKGGRITPIGRSRGGLSTKINAMVDANGLPVAITLAPGQASDKAAVPALLATREVVGDVVADRGYDARASKEAAGAHPHPAGSQAAAQYRPGHLSQAQPCRALLQQTQTLPKSRNTIRKDGTQLPRGRPHRLFTPLDAFL